MATQPAPSHVFQSDSVGARAEALIEIARALYAELHHAEPQLHAIDLDSALERDLGFDSLARVELLVRLEREFGVHLADEVLGSVETLSDLLQAVSFAPAGTHTTPAPTEAPARPESSPGVPDRASTLNEMLEWRAAQQPEAIHAIVLDEDGPRSLSYAQLRDGARTIAGALLYAGVQPGGRVALMLPTSVGYFHAFFGTLLAGAVPVPIYPPTRPLQLEEHIYRHAGVLANAGVEMLLTFQQARTVGRLLKTRVPTLRHVLALETLQQGHLPPMSASAPAANSIAMLQYTSGSTGAPKGVVLTHFNLLANIRAIGKASRPTDADVFVSWLPLYHDMGLIGAWLGSLYFGCRLVIMPPTTFLARPARWLQAIHQYRATLSAAPNFAYELCVRRLKDEELQGLDLTSWRIAFNGAEPVLPETLERFRQRFAPYGYRAEAMMPVYGLAESAVGLTFPPLGRGPKVDCIDREKMMSAGQAAPVCGECDNDLRFVSCGRPLPGYQIRVVDAGDSELAERQEGTVQFRGPSATTGYYRNPDATARLRRGEWLDTGDRGYIAEGELYITGRVKDIVIRRARHIYPDEIETAVGKLDGIRTGCVVAFGSKAPGAATESLIVVAETRDTAPDRLIDLRIRINKSIVDTVGEPPDEILLVPPRTVLKTSSGKLRRTATRASYENGLLGKAPDGVVIQMLRVTAWSVGPALRRLGQSSARLAYGVYAWIAVLAFGVAMGLLIRVVPSRERTWRLIHVAAKWLIRICHIPFSVTYETPFDPSRVHLIVTNHCSYVDSIFIAALLPTPHVFVAKAELRRVPVLGACLHRMGTLFIDRFAPVQNAAEEVNRVSEQIARGNSVAMFPEGTFTRSTGLRAFHLGAFQAAVAANSPVIPVALRGTRSVLRDGQRLIRRMPVSAVIGTPIVASPAESAFAAAVQLRDAARGDILRHCGEPDLI